MSQTMWYERLFGVEESQYEKVKDDLQVDVCPTTDSSYITGPNKIRLALFLISFSKIVN